MVKAITTLLRGYSSTLAPQVVLSVCLPPFVFFPTPYSSLDEPQSDATFRPARDFPPFGTNDPSRLYNRRTTKSPILLDGQQQGIVASSKSPLST